MGELHIPRAVYGCAHDFCAEEVSYPPDMLYWSEKEQDWFCDNCFDYVDDPLGRKGIRLDRYLEQARARLAEQREAELVEALRELRSAEWMVTPDWCEPGKREELNDRIDAILAKHKAEGREGS